MKIVKNWSETTETYISNMEKRDNKLTSAMHEDYNEFMKDYLNIEDFMKNIFV
jgi:hypothetical protein